ncbi:MAG TPA: FAD-dependent oxidoreductase, partial [Herpetosiphonaceae bacterium]|nr:FAD-dependent oxidoreductase [Herpetosiphonaceae bacterium]
AFKHPKLKFIRNTVVTEILGDTTIEAVRLKHVDTGIEEVFATGAVFPYVGHLPNTGLFAGKIDLDRDGYIITDGRTWTSAPGVFATGDAVDRSYRQAITVAASGAQAAMEAMVPGPSRRRGSACSGRRARSRPRFAALVGACSEGRSRPLIDRCIESSC